MNTLNTSKSFTLKLSVKLNFRWFDIDEAMAMHNLHSVPEKLFTDYKVELDNILINKNTNNFAMADY